MTEQNKTQKVKTQEVLWKDRKHFMWFPWSFTKYYIQNDRLMLESGLLHTTLDETLLYRIVDLTMRQSFAGKLFNTGDIILKAKVDTSSEIVLHNISNPKKVRLLISELVEESRQSRNVVGKEFYSGQGHDHICDHGHGDDYDGDYEDELS